MADGIIINIPVKPHLRKYINRKLKVSDDVIFITTTDIIGFGICIMNTLIRKRNYYVNSSIEEIGKYVNSLDKNCTINLEVSGAIVNSCGFFVNNEKIFYINKFIEKQFRNEMSVFIHANSLYNAKFVMEYGMDDFLAHFNISEDDIDKSTLIRFFQRNKNIYSYINY